MKMRELDPHASVADYFGSELRRYRLANGCSQEDLGRLINYTGGLVCMVETAKRLPSFDFAQRCDQILATDGALSRLWPLVNRDNHPDWFRGYVELEAMASAVRNFQPSVVPGLIQTEDYVRAQLSCLPRRTSTANDDLVAARMGRQDLLTKDKPPLCWFIMDEAALRRPIGSPTVMRSQFRRFLEVAELPHVVLQVVPFSAGAYAGLDGPLVIFSFDDGPDIGYSESHACSAILIHRPERVAECQLAFQLTQAAALSPKLSADLIMAAMEEL